MNFYNDDEKKDGAPVIPSAASPFKKTSAFGKTPMFSRAAGGIFDRLKNLSRKDMAFVGIGLSVLVTAPVAEYMMSQPSQDRLLTSGFGDRGKDGSAGIFEPGVNGLSTGSSDGSGEVITPLSARDPASLILGSQPAQPVMPPPSAPASTSFRDAMKESGREAFSAASRSAGVPTVIPRMQAGLRSLSFGGGDGTRTSGSIGGGKIIEDARSASSKTARRSMVGPVAMAGYKGVASSTPNSASKGAFEKLRAQADKSAGNFSGGSAMNSLDKAAADALDIGKGAGGLGAGGETEKTGKTSGNTTKYDHNRSGESLAETAAKARQAEALKWEFFKKYEIKKQLVTAMVGALGTTLGKFISGSLEDAFGLTPGPAAKCYNPKYLFGPDADKLEAKEHCKGSSDPLCVIKFVCQKDGGPMVTSYQIGKEATTAMKKECICDGISPSAGSVTTGNPPVISPGATPEQISDNTATALKAYDEALLKVLSAIDLYRKFAADHSATESNQTPPKPDPKKEKDISDALAIAFTELNTVAQNGVAEILNNTNIKAGPVLKAYGDAVNKMTDDVAASPVNKDIEYIEKLRLLAKNGVDSKVCSLKMSQRYKSVDPKVKIVSSEQDCQAVINEIDNQKGPYKMAVASLATAKGALLLQQNKKVAYSGYSVNKMSRKVAVDALTERHAEVPKKVAEILEKPNMDMAKKIMAIAETDTGTKMQKLEKTKEDAPPPEGDISPLRLAAEQLRGLYWPAVFSRKFDSTQAAKKEQSVWEEAAAKNLDELEVPPNFVASLMRAREFSTALAAGQSSLDSIKSTVDVAASNSRLAVSSLKNIVADCYFTELGCTNPPGDVVTPPVTPGTPTTETPPVTPPVPPTNQVSPGTIQGLSDHAGRISTRLLDREVPDAKLLADIKKLPAGPNKQAAVDSAAALVKAKENLQTAQTEAAALKKKKPLVQADIEAASDKLGDAEADYNTAISDASKKYTAAKPKPTQPKPDPDLPLRKADMITASNHRIAVDACYNSTTGFEPFTSVNCSREVATRAGVIALNAKNYETWVNSDDKGQRATYLGHLVTQRTAIHKWAQTCIKPKNFSKACTPP